MARSVKPAIRNAVATRARFRCEYCLRDHIISENHEGAYDASSGMLIPLFNPRTDRWEEHFGLQFGEIVPLSTIG